MIVRWKSAKGLCVHYNPPIGLWSTIVKQLFVPDVLAWVPVWILEANIFPKAHTVHTHLLSRFTNWYFFPSNTFLFWMIIFFFHTLIFPLWNKSHCVKFLSLFNLSRQNSWPVKRGLSTQCNLKQGELTWMKRVLVLAESLLSLPDKMQVAIQNQRDYNSSVCLKCGFCLKMSLKHTIYCIPWTPPCHCTAECIWNFLKSILLISV